jgi:serine phosphatase RsbU (regulator of sigma subunit)
MSEDSHDREVVARLTAELAALTAAFEDSRTQSELAMEAAEIGWFEVELSTGERVLDARMRALLGYNPGEPILSFGDSWRNVHPADVDAVKTAFAGVVESGQDYRVEFRALQPDRSARWIAIRGRGRKGPGGTVTHILGAGYDVSEARSAREHVELLAAVSAELTTTLDAEATVATLTKLVVPTLADWCIVSVIEDDVMRDVGWWHVDPDRRDTLDRYARCRLDGLRPEGPVWEARTLRQASADHSGATELALRVLGSDEAKAAIIELAPHSSVALRLLARGRVVGVISLYRSKDRPPMSDGELTTAQGVADRAAQALDNARLYQQQRRVAESLQRSLLTEPPEPDHLQIVVRYVAAQEAASVGGDWFDAFLQTDGATVLVIGDVVGHDTQATAAMGQLRGLLRGIAWESGAGPAQVLGRLDAAIDVLQVATTATAIVARIEQTEQQRAAGVRLLRWSNAGHPPPLSIQPDGEVGTLEGAQIDLLLGIDPQSPRTETAIELHDGATVVLYTDGLVERRDQSIDEGLAKLRLAAGDLAELPLDAFCDHLVASMLPGRAEDDVALVAIRVLPQTT